MGFVRTFSLVAAGTGTAVLVYSDNYTNSSISPNGIFRFLRTASTVLSVNLDYTFTQWKIDRNAPELGDQMMDDCHNRSAIKIKNVCLKNGGIYIKLGQVIGSFYHILPKQYLETLKVLYSEVKARPYDNVESAFMQQFGKKPDEMFKEFDREAIAAASLSQVHKAVTKEGEIVAVKVQYAELERNFMSDIRTLRIWVRIVDYMNPTFSLRSIIENGLSAAIKEIDFENEALNSERCARELKHLKFVKIPRVYHNLSNKRILTMEFADGCLITDTDGISHAGLNITEVSEKMVKMFAEQIFITGFVHADPHPGNILVQSKDGKAVLVLIDHGLYQEYTPRERMSLCGFYKSIMNKNFPDMKKHCRDLGVDEYLVMAQMITQTRVSEKEIGLPNKLTDEDLVAMRKLFQENLDKVFSVLQKMPGNLLLVMRNIHFVRFIVRRHGNVANRHGILTALLVFGSFGII